MPITYDWDFGDLTVAPLENDLKFVIKEVPWFLFAREGANGDEVVEMAKGVATLPDPSAGTFVPFKDITKVWLKGALLNATPPGNVVALKNELAAKIKIAMTPPLVKLPPPYKTKV